MNNYRSVIPSSLWRKGNSAVCCMVLTIPANCLPTFLGFGCTCTVVHRRKVVVGLGIGMCAFFFIFIVQVRRQSGYTDIHIHSH
jgi:hypothetical protein